MASLYLLIGRHLMARHLRKHHAEWRGQLGLTLADANDRAIPIARIRGGYQVYQKGYNPPEFFVSPDGSTHEEKQRQKRFKALHKAETVFGIVTAGLPPRIVNEEIGDALEDIRNRMERGRPSYEITLKTWATTFWVLFHSATYALRKIGKAVSSFRRTSK